MDSLKADTLVNELDFLLGGFLVDLNEDREKSGISAHKQILNFYTTGAIHFTKLSIIGIKNEAAWCIAF